MSSPSRPIPRVVVTGMGAVTPAGPTAAATYARVSEGRGCTGTDLTAPVTDFDPSTVLDPREARRVDRVGQFGLVAAAEALGQAGLVNGDRPAALDPTRVAVVVGSGVGGLGTLEDGVATRVTRGSERVGPLLVPMMMPNAAGAAISMRYGLRGPNETICTACAASTHAIGYAARMIAWGMIDACVTGGSESAGCGIGVASFALPTSSRPPIAPSRPMIPPDAPAKIRTSSPAASTTAAPDTSTAAA